MPTIEDPSKFDQTAAKKTLIASWRSWMLCVAAPGIWLVYVLVNLPLRADNGDFGAQSVLFGRGNWLVVLAIVWLALAGPAIFVLRSYCFRAIWDGRSVEPDSYLKGMGSFWAVFVVGAVMALAGSVLAGQGLPGVIVAGLAIAGILVACPNRQALGLGTPDPAPGQPTHP